VTGEQNPNPGQSNNNPAVEDKTPAQKLFPEQVSENAPPAADPPPAKVDDPPAADPTKKAEPVADPPAKVDPPAADPAKVDDKTPKAPEYKVPEVFKDSKDVVDEVLKFATENKLTPEQTQTLLDREANIAASQSKDQIAQFDAQKKKWAEEAKADPVIGGEKFEENLKLANQFFNKAPKMVQTYLQNSGLANHKTIIGWFAELEKVASPDKLVPAANEIHGETKPIANRLYANHK
jgi:hypothetical protein